MKMLDAFLILATILLGITSIIFFVWHDVADAIYVLVWAVWMAVVVTNKQRRGEHNE